MSALSEPTGGSRPAESRAAGPTGAALEHGRLFDAAARRLQDEGLAALIELAPVPLFVLGEAGRLWGISAYSYCYGAYGWEEGRPPRRGIAWLHVKYDVERPRSRPARPHGGDGEAVVVDNLDDDEELRLGHPWERAAASLVDAALRRTAVRDAARRRPAQPPIAGAALVCFPFKRAVVRLASGETVTWEVRTLSGTPPLVHARAVICGTSVGVAAAGPIAAAADELLSGITRLGATGATPQDLPSLERVLRSSVR